MKSQCKNIQRILISERFDLYDSEEQKLIEHHLENCADCKAILEKVKKADGVIDRIKKPILSFSNEEDLTNSIMAQIRKEKYQTNINPFDSLMDFLSNQSVRFALGFVLILVTLSFISMEYTDTKQIVSLEQKMGDRWNQKLIYSGVIQQEEDLLKFFYDTYKLINGKSSYLEISKELVLIKKEDLRAFFNDYNKLDDATKIRLNEMRIQFLKDTSSVLLPGIVDYEKQSLRKEVERLTEELERRTNKRGLK